MTEPSAAENCPMWHGQVIVPSATCATMQPSWVQTAVNALKVPAVGWVTTTCLSSSDHAAADRDVAGRDTVLPPSPRFGTVRRCRRPAGGGDGHGRGHDSAGHEDLAGGWVRRGAVGTAWVRVRVELGHHELLGSAPR